MASTKTMSSCLSLAALFALLQLCAAAQYRVGDSSGWELGVNYTRWAAPLTFRVGDTLFFRFAQGAHNVLQVSQANYDSCTTANAILTNTTANAVVSLSNEGQHWYICGIPGHCNGGMKLPINVLAASTSAPPPSTSAPPPATQAGAPSNQIPPPTLPQGPQAPPGSGAEKMAMGSAALLVAGLMLLV